MKTKTAKSSHKLKTLLYNQETSTVVCVCEWSTIIDTAEIYHVPEIVDYANRVIIRNHRRDVRTAAK